MSEENLEPVSQTMMDEINSETVFDDIVRDSFIDYESLDSGFDFPETHKYLQYNYYDNGAYLKIIKHINGEPQFKAEKPKKYAVRVIKLSNDASFSQLEDRWMLMYIGICPRYTEKLLSISSDELGLLINGYLPTTIDKEKFSVLLKTMLDNENYYYEFNKNNDSFLGYTPLKEVVEGDSSLLE